MKWNFQVGVVGGWLMVAAPIATAQSARHLSVQTKSDQYELVVNGQSGSVNGKPAEAVSVRELLEILGSPVGDDCTAKKGTPDATVRENGKARYVYLKEGMISDGTHCVNISGEGLAYFPLHRDFLIGSKHDGIAIKSPMQVFHLDTKVADLKKNGDSWTSEGESPILLNWDFMERFESSLRSFDVRSRVLPVITSEKPKVVVVLGGARYEFYKITTVLWAVKKPGSHWLETSDDWSFWYDFDNGLIEDRFAPAIHQAEDKAKPVADRLAILEKIENSWSRNLRDLYQRILLDKEEDHSLKEFALKRLRSKPAKETAIVMAQFIAQTDDEDFKRSASQILKINDPKGPLYKPTAPPEERAKVLEYWDHWLTQNRH